MINVEDNRFCYLDNKPSELGCKYCTGNIKLITDTVIFKSDFDLMNLPIHVVGSSEINLETSRISLVFNRKSPHDNSIFPKKMIKEYRSMSYIIINNKDTISLEVDSILYKEPIVSFSIIGCYKPLSLYEFELENSKKRLLSISDSATRHYLFEYLKELEQDSLANPSINRVKTVYKTRIYNNIYNYNELNVSIDIFDIDNYETMNDTIILQPDMHFKWVNGEGYTTIFRQCDLDSLMKVLSFKPCM